MRKKTYTIVFSVLLIAVVGIALVNVASAHGPRINQDRYSEEDRLILTEEQAVEVASQIVPDGEVNFVHHGPVMWMVAFDTEEGQVLVAVNAYTGEANIAPFEGRRIAEGCIDQEGEPIVQSEEQAVEIASELVLEGEVAVVHQGPCMWVVVFDTDEGKVVVKIDSYTGEASEGPEGPGGKPGFERGCDEMGDRGKDIGGFGRHGMDRDGMRGSGHGGMGNRGW